MPHIQLICYLFPTDAPLREGSEPHAAEQLMGEEQQRLEEARRSKVREYFERAADPGKRGQADIAPPVSAATDAGRIKPLVWNTVHVVVAVVLMVPGADAFCMFYFVLHVSRV